MYCRVHVAKMLHPQFKVLKFMSALEIHWRAAVNIPFSIFCKIVVAVQKLALVPILQVSISWNEKSRRQPTKACSRRVPC